MQPIAQALAAMSSSSVAASAAPLAQGLEAGRHQRRGLRARPHHRPTGCRAIACTSIRPAAARCTPACRRSCSTAFERTCGKPGRAIRFLTERWSILLVGRRRRCAAARAVAQASLGEPHHAPAGAAVRARRRRALRQDLHPLRGTRRPRRRAFRGRHARPRATSWSPPTAAARGCAASSCRRPSASIPAWSASPARCSSTTASRAASRAAAARRASRWCRRKGGFEAVRRGAGLDGVRAGRRRLGTTAIASRAAISTIPRSYLMWALGGAARRSSASIGEAEQLPGEALRAIASRAMAPWDERLHDPGAARRSGHASAACRSARRYRSRHGRPGASRSSAMRSIP